MNKRDLLLQKMCEAFETDSDLYPVSYRMEKSLEMAERFFEKAELPQEETEKVTYAHRAMICPTSPEKILPIIHNWLRFDTSLNLRKTITAEDCEKLARRLSVLVN